MSYVTVVSSMTLNPTLLLVVRHTRQSDMEAKYLIYAHIMGSLNTDLWIP